MEHRKNFIVDKKFQLKTALSIIGIVYILIISIVVIIGINAALNNRKLSRVIEKHKNIIVTQYDSFSSLLAVDQQKNWDQLSRSTDKMAKDIDVNMDRIKHNIETIKEININNNFMMAALIIFIIVQGFIMYYLLLRRTARISGPIHLMQGHMEEILKGNVPTLRPLRDTDEFKEFYQTFVKMVDKIQELENKPSNGKC